MNEETSSVTGVQEGSGPSPSDQYSGTPPQPPAGAPPYSPGGPSGPWDHRHDRSRGGLTAGVVLIVLGLIFLASEFIPGLDLGRLWPLILVIIGVSIILRRR